MTEKLQLAMLGASGHGKVCADIAEQLNYQVDFYDDRHGEIGESLEHWPLVGDTQDLIARRGEYDAVFVSVGNNAIRQKLYSRFQSLNTSFATLVSPKAIVSPYAEIEDGCVVMPSAVLNAYCKVAQGAIVNTASVVEHDCVLGECSHLSPNAALAGAAEIGSCTWVGIGACVKQLVKIGSNTIVGAGSVVVNDLPEGIVAFGNPAIEKQRL